jgi:hypothetical protein
VHESQIQHKVSIDPDLMCRLRRHSLKQYTDAQLINLSQKLIQQINLAQQQLQTPHKGLTKFVYDLERLTRSQ